MSRLTTSDDALRRSLRPGPEVAPPAGFSASIAQAISGVPQQRHAWQVVGPRSRQQLFLLGQLLLLIALILALIVGAVTVGSLRQRPLGAGPVYVADSGQLQMIDIDAGVATPVLDVDADANGLTRSPRGRYLSFWTGSPPDTLELVRADGSDPRRLAANLTPAPIYQLGIDVWSADDRYLASGVRIGDAYRILVVEVASGAGHLIGPADGAGSPLISPDGEWIAFTHGTSNRTLGVMRLDGSETHDIAPARTRGISGPDNWSPDGQWVYFDDGYRVLRADVEVGQVDVLTSSQRAAAPALSPDGSQVAYMVWTRNANSIWLMDADGKSPHELVADGDIRGWTADGRYVLAAYPAGGTAVDLIAADPLTGERRTLLHVDDCSDQCFQNIGTGVPRP